MTSVVLTTNQISSTGTYFVGSDEDLQIVAGVLVVGETGTDDGIALNSTASNDQIDADGYVAGADDGIYCVYESGDELISVGPTGSVVGNILGIDLYNYNGNNDSLSQAIDNSGYIYGGTDGLNLENAATQITNSGRIVGGVIGIDVSNKPSFGSTIIVNDASGVISGATAIDTYSLSVQIINAGDISSTASTGGVLLGENATVENSGTIEGADDTVDFEISSGSLQNSGKISSGNQAAVLAQAGYTSIENSGDIESHDDAVLLDSGDDTIQNSGTISASNANAIEAVGDNVTIDNSGVISAQTQTVYLVGTSGLDWIVNETGGAIEAQGTNYALYVLGDATHIINHGDISGSIYAPNASTFANTGDYDGQAVLSGGDILVRNTGKMTFDGYPQNLAAVASVQSESIEVSGENIYIAGASGDDDRLVNTVGGVISDPDAVAIYHGFDGTFRLVNHGDIYGDVDLYGQSSVANVGLISGELNFNASASLLVNRDLIDGDVTFTGTGNIYRGLAGEVTGTIYGAGADGRYLGGAADDTFDMTASGAKYVSGGAGDDTFLFTAAGLTAQTRVLGGSGDDTLTFTTAGTFSPSAFAHVSGIETINLGSGNNNIAVTNALASSADGGTLTINGNSYIDTINASAVTTATDTVTMYGGIGADTMTAGGGKDIFAYHAVNESTGPNYDTIAGVNFAIDRFDVSAVAKTILAVNPAVTTGALSTATFNTDLAGDIHAPSLGAHDAVLFTASGGTLSGQTFLVIDVNGTAGYQANADLVIHLTGQTGTLTTASFV